MQALLRNQTSTPQPWWGPGGMCKRDLPANFPNSLGIPRASKDQLLYGPTTFFVSHCWAYKLRELTHLVMKHYDNMPGTQGGRVWVPYFYCTLWARRGGESGRHTSAVRCPAGALRPCMVTGWYITPPRSRPCCGRFILPAPLIHVLVP